VASGPKECIELEEVGLADGHLSKGPNSANGRTNSLLCGGKDIGTSPSVPLSGEDFDGKPSREAAVVEVRLLGAAESLSSSKMAHEAVIVEVEFDDAWALLASLAMLKLPIPPPTAANGSRKTMGRE